MDSVRDSNPDSAPPNAAGEPDERGPLLAAIHLAGHAVAAAACGLPYPALELERPDANACSYVAARDGRGGGPARTGIEAAIIATLAGPEAERLAGGEAVPPCLDMRGWLTDGDPREAEPYLDWLRLKAERTVEHPLRQRLILAIARALLECGALRGPEIEELARHETGLYMRGQ